MPSTHFIVPISDGEKSPGALDAAAQKLEQVECGLVSPVNIFEYNERGGPAFQFIERGCKDLVAGRTGPDGSQQGTLGLPSDVVQRSQRARRKERIACAPQH